MQKRVLFAVIGAALLLNGCATSNTPTQPNPYSANAIAARAMLGTLQGMQGMNAFRPQYPAFTPAQAYPVYTQPTPSPQLQMIPVASPQPQRIKCYRARNGYQVFCNPVN